MMKIATFTAGCSLADILAMINQTFFLFISSKVFFWLGWINLFEGAAPLTVFIGYTMFLVMGMLGNPV